MTQNLLDPGAGGPNKPPLTQPYVTVGGDSLPSIAELYGHPGEWQAVAELNVGVWPDYNNLQPGLSLTVPAAWVPVEGKPAEAEPEHASRAHVTRAERD